MKTVTFDEKKWALVPIKPTPKQLADAAFNLCSCGYFDYVFVEKNGDFAQAAYSALVYAAPAHDDSVMQ